MEYPDDFRRFWAAYPRKVGKPAAYKAFNKALKSVPLQTILDAVEAYVARWDKIGTPTQYIPHATTWLNQERYSDDPCQAVPDQPADRNTAGQTALAGLHTALAELEQLGHGQTGTSLDLSEDADF